VGRGSTKPIVEQKSGSLSTRSGGPVLGGRKNGVAARTLTLGVRRPEDFALEGGGDPVYPRLDPERTPERTVLWSSAGGETKQFDRRE
jgi:hypothetical protein